MPAVNRSARSTSRSRPARSTQSRGKRPRPTKPTRTQLTLPTAPTPPVQSLEECIAVIYGDWKIGKTSLTAQFDKPLFAMFEPGAGGLSLYRCDIESWEQFRDLVALLKSDSQFKTVVVDTAAVAYEKCMDWVCEKEGVSHPSEGSFGDVWNGVRREYHEQLAAITRAGKGLVLTAHSVLAEKVSPTGKKYTRTQPNFAKQAGSYCNAVADVIAYYGYHGTDRYLWIRGSDELDAGQRLKSRFWVRGQEGERRVVAIPMGRNPEEGYANLVRAFNNEQETDGDPTIPAGETPARTRPRRRRNRGD